MKTLFPQILWFGCISTKILIIIKKQKTKTKKPPQIARFSYQRGKVPNAEGTTHHIPKDPACCLLNDAVLYMLLKYTHISIFSVFRRRSHVTHPRFSQSVSSKIEIKMFCKTWNFELIVSKFVRCRGEMLLLLKRSNIFVCCHRRLNYFISCLSPKDAEFVDVISHRKSPFLS